MRATLTRYLEALKKRRSSDDGFSLIELIVVVAILGILVAIAIPVFGGIQETAKVNALKTVAANAATQVASQIAADPTTDTFEFDSLSNGGEFVITLVAPATGTAVTIDNYCVQAVDDNIADADDQTQTAGPACPAPAPAEEG